MRKIHFKHILLTVLALSSFAPIANASSQDAHGNVTIDEKGSSDLLDPEFPDQVVDPGSGYSTEGSLRIDYVSDLSFGTQKIKADDRVYHSLAQQFHSDTNPRGYYIQISDFSSESAGWNLTVTQATQFKSDIIQDMDSQELEGAVLSFDKGWANSNGSSNPPNVTRDAMQINEMGIAYNVATSSKGEGKGTWLIEFGASEDNESDQTSTLSLLKDDKGKDVIDSKYNKPAYSNSAVSLTVPKETKIYPVQYTTTLIWTLEASPSL